MDQQGLQKARDLTQIIYLLYAASIFAGITAVIAIIINYLKRDEVAGTWLESHFRWQIRTFWFSVLWLVIGSLTIIIFIGFIIWGIAGIWAIYRIVKGMLNFYDNKPMYEAA
jgi:uncharacterized membrane protein